MVSQRSGGARTTRGRTPDETADQTTDQSHATNERHAEVEALQRSAGNRATALLLARGQAKLRVGASDDRFEREADDMAARVVRALGGRGPSANETANDADGGGSSEGVQRRALVGEAGGDLDASTESMIARARQGGESLAPAVRRTMETTIGADFGGVRLHTGDAADALNEQVQARAFTIGNDIFFHGGAPDVGSAAGQELLAHELTHTVQQGASALRRTTDTVSLDAAPALQRKSGGKGKGKPKKKGGRGKGGGGGGGGSPVTFTAIEEPTFGEAEGAPSETEEVAAEETVVEETPVEETAAPETAAPETAAPKKLGKRARATANAKARAEAEAKAQAEAAATKKAEEDAAALAAQEAAAKKKAEEEAAAKDLFVKNGKVTKDKMNAAKTAAAPYFYIDVAHLTEMSKSIDDGLAVPVPVYADLAATLKRLYDASVKVLELVPWAAAGRLNKNGAKILVQKPTAISGDGGKNEQAAVKECIDAIGGVGTWNGTCANGDPGKWGVQHGNAEGNLPPGGYKEYYVRAPAGVGGPGRRRIVVHNATGRMYYSWTHYGDNGNPPFVLLRA